MLNAEFREFLERGCDKADTLPRKFMKDIVKCRERLIYEGGTGRETVPGRLSGAATAPLIVRLRANQQCDSTF